MSYDVVIVGAGIAGLTCGIHLQSKGLKTCILEKYGYTGGRVVTYKKNGYHWENGAGRISNHHTKVHALLKKYGLHTLPIGSDQLYMPKQGTEDDLIPNTFELQLKALLEQVKHLPASLLATHTLEQLFKGIMGESECDRFLSQFAYRAEVTVMRADLAMESFMDGGEMGSYDGYTVCAEGLSSLIDAMVKDYESLGGTVFLRHELIEVSQPKTVVLKCRVGSKKEGYTETTFEASRCILALHSSALKECPSTRHFPALRHVVMCPLLRTYGVFPTHKGKSWFSDLPRVVTGHPVRYFIPIDGNHGVAMVSYTDADDASRMMKLADQKGENGLGSMILKDLRSMFPDRTIPEYTFFKMHPWTHGCTYWTPGSYDVKEESKRAMHPDPKNLASVYVCGESFSLRQAWMEGAIEHAEALLKTHF